MSTERATHQGRKKGATMIGGLRRVSYTGVLVALTILFLAGCERATGGGYITSATGEGKATFAFSGKCTNTTFEGDVAAVTKGQIQYNDRAADVKFHANIKGILIVIPAPPDTCDELDADGSTDFFTGTYRVPGGPKEEAEEGTVDLVVTDAGEPGINGDRVTISLAGGPYDGYFNSGTVQGGNVQVH